MKRSDALRVLARAKPELAKRFGVVRLVLFGSMARDEVRPDSDVRATKGSIFILGTCH
ncbi:MAG: hypothetical protein D9V46_11395 [Deltaproteobacteria bacterium]|jgi:predicted nucleotidyltransferase|uniref:nucleotidyltransferase family protein n=1 Tax=Hydrosulfovibrio ferrireducens TaxID=2934181 RepID=UPI001212173F|nr:MAG: hypothetical protein D9V46_11395 [Deltaproteobacteria bacterium]